MKAFPVLHTERLLLRGFESEDAPEIQRLGWRIYTWMWSDMGVTSRPPRLPGRQPATRQPTRR